MKVVLVGRYGEGEIVTGPERVAREIFSELIKKNNQVVFIDYFFSGYEGTTIFKKLFGKKIVINNSVIRFGIVPFLFTLSKKKFEIIHIINSQRFILFLLLLKHFIAGSIVTTFHGLSWNEIPKNYLWRKRYFIDQWVEKLLVNKSSLLIFPSKLLYGIFNNQYKISNQKYEIIPNGVSEIFWNQATSFPDFENSVKLVFYSGFNSTINRGLDKLLDMMKDLKYEVELYVIGDIVEVMPQKNIKFYFTGPLSHDELIKFVSDKQFIIKSSVFDSFSIVIAECMSLGLIPIVNENIGIKDMINHGENGFVYDSSSSNDLSELMNEIYNGKYDLNLISENAKKIILTLNWQNIAAEYVSAYNKLL
jgi:glycosyltransferase involved in cell wall biosynthesis